MNRLNELAQDSRTMGEHNDCSVRAVAVACRVSYAKAHAALKAAGRKNRRGAYRFQTHAACKALGYSVEQVKVGARTVRSLRLPSDSTYLVHVRRHVLGVADGEVVDWTKGRMHRIQEVYRVTPTEKVNIVAPKKHRFSRVKLPNGKCSYVTKAVFVANGESVKVTILPAPKKGWFVAINAGGVIAEKFENLADAKAWVNAGAKSDANLAPSRPDSWKDARVKPQALKWSRSRARTGHYTAVTEMVDGAAAYVSIAKSGAKWQIRITADNGSDTIWANSSRLKDAKAWVEQGASVDGKL